MSSRRRSDPPYRVELTSAAARQVRKLTPTTRTELHEALRRLAFEPRGPNVAKLAGLDAYRLRSSDYRAVFQIEDRARAILVLLVAHRREVYRRIRRLDL